MIGRMLPVRINVQSDSRSSDFVCAMKDTTSGAESVTRPSPRARAKEAPPPLASAHRQARTGHMESGHGGILIASGFRRYQGRDRSILRQLRSPAVRNPPESPRQAIGPSPDSWCSKLLSLLRQAPSQSVPRTCLLRLLRLLEANVVRPHRQLRLASTNVLGKRAFARAESRVTSIESGHTTT